MLRPVEYIGYEGLVNATFQCTIANVDAEAVLVYWNVNGIPPDEAILSGEIITAQYKSPNETTIQAALIIVDTSSYGNVTVDCFGKSGRQIFWSNGVSTFVVQGEKTSMWVWLLLCFDSSKGNLEKCENSRIQAWGEFHQILTWDSPFTLDITNIHPDIFGYKICSELLTTCTYIDLQEHGGDDASLRQFIFPNLRMPTEVNITAVNIVGDGQASWIHFPSCNYTYTYTGKWLQ